MRRAFAACLVVGLSFASEAAAGNSDEVNAGVDVTLTGGAVVANVTTGAALWYNPAGIARIPDSSFEITGVTFKTSIVRYPGLLTLDSGERSNGKTTNLALTPEALVFTVALDRVKMGIGVFNSSLRRELVQESVESMQGSTPEAIWRGAVNARTDFVHVSTGFAHDFNKRKQKVLVGGAFDIIVGTNRVDSVLAGTYDLGAEGAYSDSLLQTDAGFGLQLKAGIQWVPIPQVRVGFMLSTPSYMFMLAERRTGAVVDSGPDGSGLPTLAQTSSSRRFRGGWFGAEPGTLRLGIAYIGMWGWVEADLVVDFRLQSERFLFTNRNVVNGRAATIFDVNRHFKLGVGLFTDFSATRDLINLGDRQVDFFGLNLGFLFSNRETRPGATPTKEEEGKTPIAIAIGVRYSYGRGDTYGALIPASYPPPPDRLEDAITFQRVRTQVHDIDFNFGVKVLF
jgi:hypothetical protein